MVSYISKYSFVERLSLDFDSFLGSRLFSICKIWDEKLILNIGNSFWYFAWPLKRGSNNEEICIKIFLYYFYTFQTSENRLYSKQPEWPKFYVDIIKMSGKVKEPEI